MDFKEMIIRKPRTASLPSLDLNGKWLDQLGFTNGRMVHATFADSCLILKPGYSQATGISLIMVRQKFIRKQSPRTRLVLDGYLLHRYGFKVGDRIGLTLTAGMIQIAKINRLTDEKPAV